MALWLDARIPVLMDPAVMEAGDAMLVEAGAAAPAGVPCARFVADGPHPAGCACCVARYGAALALDRLFLLRARGEVAFFRRVVARPSSAAGAASLREALASDPVDSARYRLG